MRLWHQKLIPFLPRQQLLGQHRECCALRGLGWDKRHSTVQYALDKTLGELAAYHYLVMNEMVSRGYFIDLCWVIVSHRGKKCAESYSVDLIPYRDACERASVGQMIYPEHDDKYLQECLDNLKAKGIEIEQPKESA